MAIETLEATLESTSPRIGEAAALAFCTGVIAVATAMLWVGRLNGDHWVAVATWVTAALMFSRAAAVVADGYVVSAQARLHRSMQREVRS